MTFQNVIAMTLIAMSWIFPTSVALAGELVIRAGPPTVGTGGANPVGIPPSATDLDFSWVTEAGWETSLSIAPGLLFGKRFKMSGYYVGLGGGIIIDGNGAGPGPYSSFGYETSGSYVRYNVEVKQAIGLTSKGTINPYAFRMGAAIVF